MIRGVKTSELYVVLAAGVASALSKKLGISVTGTALMDIAAAAYALGRSYVKAHPAVAADISAVLKRLSAVEAVVQANPALSAAQKALVASPVVAQEAPKIESAVAGALHTGPLVEAHAAPPVAAAAVATPAPAAVAPEVTPPATPAPATPLPSPTVTTVTNVPIAGGGATSLDVGQIAPVDAPPAVQTPPVAG